MYYKRQKLDNETEKDVVTKEIISVTFVIEKIRKDIKLCDKVYDKVPRMKEQLRELEDKEKENSKEKKLKEKR